MKTTKLLFSLLLAVSVLFTACKEEPNDVLPTCSDGVQNGTETAVDCGGSCAACSTCPDGIQNGTETGVDCGGSCSPCVCGVNKVADADGNVYNTVLIGSQCWLKENLKTTKYNDGSSIPHVTDGNQWAALTTGAYSYFSNDTANQTVYGNLYNWEAVNTGELAPAGWHVPSAAEWDTLISFLGGVNVAADKMKEAGAAHWSAFNASTNSSGFTGLGGGENRGFWSGFRNYGVFWTSTEVDSINAKQRGLNEAAAFVYLFDRTKMYGLSVRCVKD